MISQSSVIPSSTVSDTVEPWFAVSRKDSQPLLYLHPLRAAARAGDWILRQSNPNLPEMDDSRESMMLRLQAYRGWTSRLTDPKGAWVKPHLWVAKVQAVWPVESNMHPEGLGSWNHARGHAVWLDGWVLDVVAKEKEALQMVEVLRTRLEKQKERQLRLSKAAVRVLTPQGWAIAVRGQHQGYFQDEAMADQILRQVSAQVPGIELLEIGPERELKKYVLLALPTIPQNLLPAPAATPNPVPVTKPAFSMMTASAQPSVVSVIPAVPTTLPPSQPTLPPNQPVQARPTPVAPVQMPQVTTVPIVPAPKPQPVPSVVMPAPVVKYEALIDETPVHDQVEEEEALVVEPPTREAEWFNVEAPPEPKVDVPGVVSAVVVEDEAGVVEEEEADEDDEDDAGEDDDEDGDDEESDDEDDDEESDDEDDDEESDDEDDDEESDDEDGDDDDDEDGDGEGDDDDDDDSDDEDDAEEEVGDAEEEGPSDALPDKKGQI